MVKQLMHVEIEYLAEGASEPVQEPDMPLKTMTVPIITSDTDPLENAAETGINPVVSLSEGQDSEESQDASLTTDETQAQPDAAKTPNVSTDESPTVLIVEDTTELAEIIAVTLENLNMVTAHETHGNKALEKFNEMNPDIILLDISLPDMTGWKIMDAIKERQQSGDKMPVVIVITAYDDPANRLVGKLQGVHSYLIKPFTTDEIEKTVKDAMSGTA